jgi:hypothetical protein
MHSLHYFREVWLGDTEFVSRPGERPIPLCLVARELRSGRLVRLWLTDDPPPTPPFGTGPDTLFVAYYACAEMGCFRALGWDFPTRILDLCVEFNNLTSGLSVRHGRGLLGALSHYDLDGLGAVEKKGMQQLALRGGPFTADERTALLDYCQSDVDALARLLPAMLPQLDVPRALLRGRYTAAAAVMEWNGTVIDVETFNRIRRQWERIRCQLIAAVDGEYHVFVPAGQRTINPRSPLGAALLREA